MSDVKKKITNIEGTPLKHWYNHWSFPNLIIGLTRSKKTFLMSTPKCLGAQIFRFTQVKLTIDPPFETARAQSELFALQCHQ